MKRLYNRTSPLLSAALCLAILTASVWAVEPPPDNPPVNCGTCECYDLEDVDLIAGGTTVDGSNPEPTDCTKISPDSEGNITLVIRTLPSQPTSECADCSETSLTVWLRDSQGKEEEMPSSIRTCEWVSPLTITIQSDRTGVAGLSICRTFMICYDPCETGCSSCSAGSPSASGTGIPDANMGSVNLEVPIGKSNYGGSFAILSLRLEDTLNTGRSALNLLGWDNIPKAGDTGGITRVVTDSSYATIATTPTADPLAYTISIHYGPYDPTEPISTVFRTVKIESPSPNILIATETAFNKTRTMAWSKSGTTWTFIDSNGKKIVKVGDSSVPKYYSETRTEYEIDPDSPSSYLATSSVATVYKHIGGWWQKTLETIATNGPNAPSLVNKWTYYEGEMSGPFSYTGAARLKNYYRYDGYIENHVYYHDEGKICHVIEHSSGSGYVERTIIWDPVNKTLDTTDKYVGNHQIARTELTYGTNFQTTRQFTSTTASHLATVSEFHPQGTGGLGGRLKKITRHDGTVTTYAYAVDGTGDLKITEDTGEFSGGVVVKGTKQMSRFNKDGTTDEVAVTAIDTGTSNDGITLNHWIVTSADSLGRPLTTTWFPTLSTTWDTTQTYACCGLASETDKFGILTQYLYDARGRRIRTNRLGVTEAVKYKGLTVSRYRYAETVSGGLFVSALSNEISRSVTYPGGTATESWGPSPQTGALVMLSSRSTTYSNPVVIPPVDLGPSIGSKVVEKLIQVSNDGATVPTQTELRYTDGSLYRSWGDLEPAMEITHGVDDTIPNYPYPYTVRSFIEGISSNGTGGTPRESAYSFRDHAGRPYRDYQSGLTNTYYHYNALGQLERTADADGVNTRYAYNSTGERTVTARKLNATTGSITWGTDQITSVETVPAVRTTGSVPVMRTTTKVWKDGDTSPTGGTVVSTVDRRTDGLQTWTWTLGTSNEGVTTTIRSGVGVWAVTTVHPDQTKTVQAYANGLWDNTEFRNASNVVVYSTSARKANNANGYDSLNRLTDTKDSRTGVTTTAYVSAISDQTTSVTAPGNRVTSYLYDHRGRRTRVDAPNTLTSTGATLLNITTTSHYPDGRTKQISGQQTYSSTYTYDYAGRMKTLTTYGGTTATTTWNYYTNSGLMSSKKDHADKGASYTYTNAGRLLTRTWQRGVSTTYGYSYGRMTSVDYFDATPDVGIYYDALGRQSTVTQTNQSQIDYAYAPGTLALDTETIQYDLDHNGSYEFTRVLDRSNDPLGRTEGYELLDGIGMIEAKAHYTYDNAGRLSTVDDGGVDPNYYANNYFTYGYQYDQPTAVDPRVGSTTGGKQDIMPYTVAGPVYTVTNTWESNRDVLDLKENKVGGFNVSSFDYGMNDLGQRTGVATSGNAFQSSRSTAWGYNTRGELVKADSSVSGFDRAYLYDGIGNRKRSANDLTLPPTDNYVANALNQYSAGTTATPVPGYDLDGNATTYAVPAYPSANSVLVWDGENRLVSANVNGVTTTYLYDAFGRRIAAQSGYPSPYVWIYDGWNPIVKYYGPYPYDVYLWGLDLSGTLQGAGGVGGLLAVSWDGFDTFYPTYDGNGNVSEYIATNASVDAHFEYDPFGNVIESTGGLAPYFPFRFSTKQQDDETGLLYYTYRHYDPLTGRWPSRDPIEEAGGENLYGFVYNDPLNYFDNLGNAPQSAQNAQRVARNQANQQNRVNNQNAAATNRIAQNANRGAATLNEAASQATNAAAAAAEVPSQVARGMRGQIDENAMDEATASCKALLTDSNCRAPCSNSCKVVFRRRFDSSGVPMGNEFISSSPRPCKSCSQEDDPKSGPTMSALGGPGFTSAPKVKVPGIGVFPPIYEDETSSYSIGKTCLDIIIK